MQPWKDVVSASIAVTLLAAGFTAWIWFGGISECKPIKIGNAMLVAGCPER